MEDGIWADLEAGDNPAYLPGHAIRRFREALLHELAAHVDIKEFEACICRANNTLPRPV